MTGVVLVLAHAHDAGASAVARRLTEARGPGSVVVARPEALGLAAWSHRVSADGQTRTRVRLPGVAVDSADVSWVFNRLQYLPVPRFHRSAPKDRDYAGAELQALVASWLLGFGPRVVNPVGPRGQSPGPLSERGWLSLAAGAGLPIARSARATAGRMIPTPEAGERIDGLQWPGGARGPAPAALRHGDACRSVGSVLVAGEEASGSLSERFGVACLILARRARCTLLEVRFVESEHGPVVSCIDPLPSLLDAEAVDSAARLFSRETDLRGVAR